MTDFSPHNGVAVMGGGENARRVSAHLMDRGFSVLMIPPEGTDPGAVPDGAECLTGARVAGLKGQVGAFTLLLDVAGRRIERPVGFAVVAYEPVHEPVYDVLGDPGHERVWTLSRAEESAGKDAFPEEMRRVIVLDRLDGFTTTGENERLMQLVARLQEQYGAVCCLVTCQVKVASAGLEMLYGRIRDGGCFVAKTDLVSLAIGPEGVTARFDDVILNEPLTAQADLLVVGETEYPASALSRLAENLGLETGPGGFLQADNVLRGSCLTNRRGVLVAGASAFAMNRWEAAQNAMAVAEEISGLYRWLIEKAFEEPIQYDRDLCATCLTCFRVCPHGAILFTDKPNFLHNACQRCGICTSLCPSEAIELSGYEKGALLKRLLPVEPGRGEEEPPLITGFVCERSFDLVRQYVEAADPVFRNIRWVEIPCAGTLRTQYILDCLGRGKGVSGVLVVSCHRDNCRSGDGTVRAGNMVGRVKDLLRTLEMDDRSVIHLPMAPNEEYRLKREVGRFKAEMGGLEAPAESVPPLR